MPKKIVITADSPVDLTPELAEKFNIAVIPLYVTIEDKTYKDGVDIFPEDIFKKYHEYGILPHTSAIPISDYSEFFSGFVQNGFAVVHLSLSSEISSTYQNAVIASDGLNDVYIVDSRSLSMGITLLAVKASEMRNNGLEALEIAEALTALREHIHASFVVDKLDFLRKGGRCSALTALGANVLGIHPCIEMQNGILKLAKKYRGKIETVQLQFLADQLSASDNIDLEKAFICHSGIPADQLEVLRKLSKKSRNFSEVLVTQAGCTISTHCGPNCVGISFLEK